MRKYIVIAAVLAIISSFVPFFRATGEESYTGFYPMAVVVESTDASIVDIWLPNIHCKEEAVVQGMNGHTGLYPLAIGKAHKNDPSVYENCLFGPSFIDKHVAVYLDEECPRIAITVNGQRMYAPALVFSCENNGQSIFLAEETAILFMARVRENTPGKPECYTPMRRARLDTYHTLLTDILTAQEYDKAVQTQYALSCTLAVTAGRGNIGITYKPWVPGENDHQYINYILSLAK